MDIVVKNIVDILKAQGNLSSRSLIAEAAKRSKRSPSTVRRRLHKMLENGVIEFNNEKFKLAAPQPDSREEVKPIEGKIPSHALLKKVLLTLKICDGDIKVHPRTISSVLDQDGLDKSITILKTNGWIDQDNRITQAGLGILAVEGAGLVVDPKTTSVVDLSKSPEPEVHPWMESEAETLAEDEKYALPVDEQQKYAFNYVATSTSLVLIRTNLKTLQTTPKNFMAGTPEYLRAFRVLHESEEKRNEVFDSLFEDKIVELLAITTKNRVVIDPCLMTVTIDGVRFNNSLIDVILDIMTGRRNEETDIGNLVNLLDKLSQNPTRDVFTRFYDFIKHNDIEICEDGDVVAWKVVCSDYKDKHSRTMDNSPGTVVRMNRMNVNDNPEITCSHGLHACAKSYIRSFRNSNDRIVRVKINPADIVAVPVDYNGAKIRTCQYTVLDDVTDKRDLWN